VNAHREATDCQLDISDRCHATHVTSLQNAQAAPDSDIPSAYDLKVFAAAWITPGVAIRNPTAAIQIRLNERAFGYCVQKHTEPYYHRPDCSDLRQGRAIARGFRALVQRRHPCPKCRPDAWLPGTREESADAAQS
jgi:hypothetical protein